MLRTVCYALKLIHALSVISITTYQLTMFVFQQLLPQGSVIAFRIVLFVRIILPASLIKHH